VVVVVGGLIGLLLGGIAVYGRVLRGEEATFGVLEYCLAMFSWNRVGRVMKG